jgi:hypothetical protein
MTDPKRPPGVDHHPDGVAKARGAHGYVLLARDQLHLARQRYQKSGYPLSALAVGKVIDRVDDLVKALEVADG